MSRARALRAEETAPIGWLTAAVLVAFCLTMVAIPWQSIWGASFNDRSVYLSKFTDLHPKSIATFTGSLLGYVVNEVLWDSSILWISSSLNVPVETLFAAVSFLCLYAFSRYLTSRHGLLALVFLVNPLVVEFAFSQLRMALAVALLLAAMFNRDRRLLAPGLVAAACLIHTATFLLLGIFFAAKGISAFLATRTKKGVYLWLALVAVGATVVVFIGPLRSALLSLVGDRRAKYDNDAEGIKYASYWIVLLLAMATQAKKYFESESNAAAAAFLAVFVVATFFNVYNSRFLAAAYPLIISAALSLNGQKKALIVPLYFVYAGAQWYYWLTAVR